MKNIRQLLRIQTIVLGLLSLASMSASTGCMFVMPNYVPAYGGGEAQLFDGMATHTRKISTGSAEAQEYFNHGLNWAYAFNHDEAVRCFTKVTELDPDCAMGWWGIAYAQGPNYNAPVMGNPKSAAAWDALQEAKARMKSATPVERAMIDALAHRYAESEPKERKDLDRAYAQAMNEVANEFPDDTDVGTIAAEAEMIRHPWKLYNRKGEPAREETNRVIKTLEHVLELDPNHPGANHLYIHALEPSAYETKALHAANRLCDLMPVSGHMLHMPSHIYVQVGEWEKSIDQNAKAMAADDRYRELASKEGLQGGYMLHNSHMLAFSAMMVGREREAMEAAEDMWNSVPWILKFLAGQFIDPLMCSRYDVLKRFGRWDELIDQPRPPRNMPVTTAVWHAHRAVAYAAKKDIENAEKEQKAFRGALRKVNHDTKWPPYDMTIKFLMTSELFVAGEIALHKNELDEAAQFLEDAVVIEDMLGYGEPPFWLQPARHALGAVYMKAKRYDDAERTFREDLQEWPGNGWSLFGLSRALEEQGKTAEADTVRREFDRAWAGADEPIETSCKCVPKL